MLNRGFPAAHSSSCGLAGLRAGTLAMLVISVAAARGAIARELPLAERVAAQEAIERVYYSHQIGATEPFGKAVSRELLEAKVQLYLAKSAALRDVWNVEVTASMLERETARILHETRTPERLREVFASLHDDPFIIQECFVRPVLVDRLVRGFYASDRVLHAEARERIERIHTRLQSGELDPRTPHPNRTLAELRLNEDERPDEVPAVSGTTRLSVDAEELAAWRRTQPAGRGGGIAPVIEETDQFKVLVPLEDEPKRLLVAIYAVPKRSWDAWWGEARLLVDSRTVPAVASPDVFIDGSVSGTGNAGASLCPDDFWKPGDLTDGSTPPLARADHTSVWTGSLMLMWGGWNSGELATGARYDPAINAWSPISSANAPSARSLHTAVWTGTQMIVWGGNTNGSTASGGGRYNPSSDTWSTMASSSPSRYLHNAVWTGTRMIVWGGYNDNDGYLNSGGRYDPSTNSWSATTTVGAPTPRYEASAIWTGSRMIVWGGRFGSTALDSGGLYDPAGDTWTSTEAANAPTPRAEHTAVWTGSKMVVWGGSDADYNALDTGGQYDPALGSWVPTNLGSAPDARYRHTAVWTGSKLIIWGGSRLASGGVYDPASDLWSPTTEIDAPEGRDSHTAIWTGSAMVVWGGWNQNGNLDDTGGRFDLSGNSWTATSHGGSSPSARWNHTGIWTGTRMIVWGGTDDPSGGAYDPVTNSWSPTTMTGAPTARFSHTAVWTGSQMIIWGGYDATGPATTGGRYDPLADSWLSMTAEGAPAARYLHTAVWTGSRMLVWGGKSNSSQLNSGGSYDPSGDSWSSISTVAAPARREAHTAVWTGSLMIVWGGYDGFTGLNTGGRYEPTSNTWIATAVQNAPVKRYDHSAVWTGTEMLVWGGRASGSYFATGGRYSVEDNTWTALTTTGAPSARAEHSAVWTGSHMIVWGGYASNGTTLGTGALYSPPTRTWAPVSNVGAMTSRRNHAAVWTGDTMLLWGGDSSNVIVGTGGAYVHALDDDLDGFTECQGDCDETDATVYGNAPQLCDGLNNDCNDPAWPTVPSLEADADHDQFSICAGDCDDSRSTVYPGAPELCDVLDNNCNQIVDEDANGLDTDADGLRNACDNCVAISNADQLDDDADGAGNVCDCRPLDPTAKQSPASFFPLAMAPDRATISWSSFGAQVGSSTLYDVLRGQVAEWPVGAGASESCRASNTTQSSIQDSAVPPPGPGYYYLIRGRNVCGTGGYGFASDGTPEVSSACP